MQSKHLEWVQPSFRETAYELRDDLGVVAQLGFEPKPAITWGFTDRRAAWATAGTSRWRFTVSRHGLSSFLGLSAVVHVTGSHAATLEARGVASRGILKFSDGRQIRWRGRLIEGATSIFSLEGDAPLVAFRTGSPLERITTRVEITAIALESQEWRLLAALGFYLRMLINRTWD